MKIRTGFVSNSSSTSFIIVGAVIDRKTQKKLGLEFKVDSEDRYQLAKQNGLDWLLNSDTWTNYMGVIIQDLGEDGCSEVELTYTEEQANRAKIEVAEKFEKLGLDLSPAVWYTDASIHGGWSVR